jgi:hypothetical protein
MHFITLLEKLTRSEIERTQQYAKMREENLDFGPIFKDSQRVIVPLKTGSVDIKTDPEVAAEVDKKGFMITDYKAGFAVKKDKSDKRLFKIGRLLNDVPELQKKFEKRMSIGGKANTSKVTKNYLMVLTIVPEDIVSMSTDKSWTSCMNIRKGEHPITPFLEVQTGGFVAYLIADNYDQKDPDWLDHSASRIAVKRFVAF